MPMMRISLFCPDRPGLVAAVTGRLFDLGANLGDTSFAVLGAGAELTALCDMPAGIHAADVERELAQLPETKGGRLSVTEFGLSSVHGPTGRITHRIVVEGDDRPGLVARLSEAFGQYGANIVTLNAEFLPGDAAGRPRYLVRFEAFLPERTRESCLATIANAAAELGQTCRWDAL